MDILRSIPIPPIIRGNGNVIIYKSFTNFLKCLKNGEKFVHNAKNKVAIL